jgi:hypothetical protein
VPIILTSFRWQGCNYLKNIRIQVAASLHRNLVHKIKIGSISEVSVINKFGLYRDDGLGIIKATPRQICVHLMVNQIYQTHLIG